MTTGDELAEPIQNTIAEAAVASISKIVSALACGVLLSVGFPAHGATAADRMKANQAHEGLDMGWASGMFPRNLSQSPDSHSLPVV